MYDLPAELEITHLQVGDELNLTFPYPEKRQSGEGLTSFDRVEIYAIFLSLSVAELPEPPPLTSVLIPENARAVLDEEACKTRRKENSVTATLDVQDILRDSPFAAVHLTAIVKDGKGKSSPPPPLKTFLVTEAPSPPSGASAESTAEGIRIRWSAESCDKAAIERIGPEGESRRLSVEEGETERVDPDVESGKTYTYRISCAGELPGIRSSPHEITITYDDVFPPPPVTDLLVSPLTDRWRVSWTKSPGADHYRLMRRCDESGWETLLETRETFVEIDSQSCEIGIRAVDAAGNTSPITPPEEHREQD